MGRVIFCNRSPGNRLRPVFALLMGVLAVSAVACGAPPESSDERLARDAGEPRVYRLASGPLQEIRIARDTDGRFVVSGFCYFPNETRLSITLRDSAGGAIARTRPVVENGLFGSLPIGPGSSESSPAGPYEIEISAHFAPSEQPDAVLEETDGGRALEGEGMFLTQRGHPAFAKRFRVEP